MPQKLIYEAAFRSQDVDTVLDQGNKANYKRGVLNNLLCMDDQ